MRPAHLLKHAERYSTVLEHGNRFSSRKEHVRLPACFATRAGLMLRSSKVHREVSHAQQLQPKLRMGYLETSDQKECHWEASYPFSHLAEDDFADLIVEYQSPGQFLERGQHGTGFPMIIQADTAELTTWILMPEGSEYANFNITRRVPGKSEKVEAVKVVTEYLADDYTILAFRLLSLKAGYTYEVNWVYKRGS